jgi:hypothetical protein
MIMQASEDSILYVASHGMEDSYRATLIFAAANAAVGKNVGTVKVALLGEATWLVNTTIAMKFSLGEVANRPQLHTLIATFLGYAKAGTANAAIGC